MQFYMVWWSALSLSLFLLHHFCGVSLYCFVDCSEWIHHFLFLSFFVVLESILFLFHCKHFFRLLSRKIPVLAVQIKNFFFF